MEEDRAIARRIIKHLKKHHQSFEETMQISRGNSFRLVRIKASGVKDENGIPQKMVGVDLDITDIKEAEEKLAETQRWLKQTAEASPDAITIYNLQEKQPVYLNNCLAEWTGKSLVELVNMGIEGRLRLIHPDDRLPLLHFNEKMTMARDGDVLSIEYRIQINDSDDRWIRNRSKVFGRDAAGKVTHVLSILQDISEEKAAERLLKSLNTSLERQNRELEAKNDEITSFAFVASHDLKEPIRKIHTFSDWLLHQEKGLSETGQRHLERLHNAVRRLDMLVEDILALTKVHTESQDLQQVNLNLVLQQARNEMLEPLEKTAAAIVANSLPTVMGVHNQLVYLFKNLISNSIKFQPPGNTPRIEINASVSGNFLKLSFTDNGIGFAPEYSKKIFQMFRRLHGKTEFEGTGMGLSICKRIMEKHGGSITAEGEVGKGARFTCWFPA
jgi:PAS domain S-box-containing protein